MALSHSHWLPYGPYAVRSFDHLQAAIEEARDPEIYWFEVNRLAQRYGYLEQCIYLTIPGIADDPEFGSKFHNSGADSFFQSLAQSESLLRGGARTSSSAHVVGTEIHRTEQAYLAGRARREHEDDVDSPRVRKSQWPNFTS